MPDHLLVDRLGDGVAVITMNRPDRMNAVTMAMQTDLDDAITELENDPDIRCGVLTGAGDRAFSAGYDIHEMADWNADQLLLNNVRREAWIWHVASSPLPLVAALNGITYGVGAIMASAMDVRIGCQAATWRFTAGKSGGANLTWSLPSIIGRGLTAELLMTSREVGPDEAASIGLVNRNADDAQAAGIAVAREIAASPRGGTREIKRLLRDHVGSTIKQMYEEENRTMREELRPPPIRADMIKSGR